MKKNFPYITCIEIMKKCRNQLIKDTLENNSPDLYDALYSNINSEIFKVKMDLYELKWIELHWTMIVDAIEHKNFNIVEKKEIISQFSEWYNILIAEWDYSELDFLMFEEKKNILKTLIVVNNEWDNNMKRMKVSFEQSKKKLNIRIRELERGV